MSGGLLAIDPSSKLTGWAAVSAPGDVPVYGHITTCFTGEAVRDNAGKIGARFAVFLESRLEILKPRYVVREAPYIPPPNSKIPINYETIYALLGLGFLIETICEQHGIKCLTANTNTAVKALTGRGKYPERKAKKRATVAACRMLGFKDVTEDEADALSILLYEEPRLFPEMRLRLVRPVNMPLFQEPDGDPSTPGRRRARP